MDKIYYSLLSREPGEPWSIQFGDYKRGVVADEWHDLAYNDRLNGRKIEYRIMRSGETQSEINAALVGLNAEVV